MKEYKVLNKILPTALEMRINNEVLVGFQVFNIFIVDRTFTVVMEREQAVKDI